MKLPLLKNNMLNKISIALLFMALNLSVFAQQTPNSVQVIISEAVEVKVKEYVYHVSNGDISSNSLFDFDYDFEEDEYEEFETILVTKPISEMLTELEAAKFKCALMPNAKYSVDPGQDEAEEVKYDSQLIEVRVKSLDELKRLSKFVLKMDDAHGDLNDIVFEDISNYHDELFPKMMKSAKRKAGLIANSADKKIGEVIQVFEGNGGLNLYGEEMSGYMESMMELSSSLWKKNVPATKTTKVTMTYVFEIK